MQLADAGERVDAAETRADRAEARAEELRRDLDAARVIAVAAQHDAQAARAETQKAQDAAEELRKENGGQEGEGAPTSRLGRLAGAIALPAADDLRRVVRRAVWQPRAVLRGLWARLGRLRE
jgi:hypothetical protein